ncbi:MAG TPA: LTA synthase family protein [Pseudomonadales bacterium]
MKGVFSRLGLPGLFVVCGLVIAFIVRLILTSTTAAELDGGLTEWLRIFAVGFVYDVTVAVYWLVPLLIVRALLPKKVLDSRLWAWLAGLFFFAGLFVLQFVAVSEWFFWDEFKSRFNFISVDYLIYRREVTDNIFESYPVYPILAGIAAVSLWVSVWAMRRVTHWQAPHWPTRFAVAGLAIVASVSGFAAVTDGLRDAFHNAYAKELAAAGQYQFFSAFRNNELDYSTFYRTINDTAASDTLKAALHSSASGLFRIDREITPAGTEKSLNVVLVVIESLSAKYVGYHGNTEGITPYMDALAQESLVFDNLYATGTRTVRGLEAISLAIPPTPGQSIVRRPGNQGLFNIATPFLDRGYDTTFFYGGHGYFDNMNAFFAGNGFNTLDRTNIPDDEVTFSNAWGVADEDIYTQVIQRADRDWHDGKAFFSFVMTTSNHRPYTYPDERIDIPSGDGRRGAVKYTDWAIGDFMARVRSKPWFDNTLFIFVADHCAGVAGKTALPVKDFHIPMMIYAPAHIPAGHESSLVTQLDIAPTLMGLLNFRYRSWYFGRDVFNERDRTPLAFIATYQDVGLLTPELLTVLQPQKKVLQFADPFGEQAELPAVVSGQDVDNTIAYYQGASYIWQHKLSKTGATPMTAASLK